MMSYESELDSARRHVASGKDLLDEVAKSHPGIPEDWRSKIDASELDIRDCQRCVLGQVFGEFYRGHKLLEAILEDYDPNYRGFDHGSVLANALNEAWREELAVRPHLSV